jgi:SAM-dependent methyltransferase
MSSRASAPPVAPIETTYDGAFDHGDGKPYSLALRDPARTLFLRDADGADVSVEHVRLEVERFIARADDGDAEALAGIPGPVIDVGCGPGRIVHAAIMAGHVTLGIDISATAVRIAQEHGLPVLRRSVFQDLPAEGTWGTALLIDGNIGIGGDPLALLNRCAQLVRPGDGRVLVETHVDPNRDRIFAGVLVDDLNRQSLPFPWAEVGATALHRYAESAGLTVTREWTFHARRFAEYARA